MKLRFDLGERAGHTIAFEVNAVPRLKLNSPNKEYKYYLKKLYIDDRLMETGKNDNYFLSEFEYYHNGNDKLFCLSFSDNAAEQLSKIFNVKNDTIRIVLPKDIEDYFINVLNPKGEKLLKATLDGIERKIIEKNKCISDETFQI